jgi:hypothetical protein
MIYYCCDSMRRLSKMDFIDHDHRGQAVIYLHNVHVESNLPLELRYYKYCIHCGIDTRMHPIEIDSKDCTTLGRGLFNKKIVLYFGQKEKPRQNDGININNQDHYVFNPACLSDLNGIPLDEANYPTEMRLDYCPYCGYGYSVTNETQNANFLILSSYLV